MTLNWLKTKVAGFLNKTQTTSIADTNKIKFLFDVDGTLTPSRRKIDPEFGKFFLDLCNERKVYLVTGSDYSKTLEQLGEDICVSVERIYNCSGNEVWSKGSCIKVNEMKLPDLAITWLNGCLKQSTFPLRTGNHIEERTGSVNFSVLGRNATLKERMMYIKFDEEHRERAKIANSFNFTFLEFEAQLGGETGIDIFKKGMDKSQVLDDFNKNDSVAFFGDKIAFPGNDYTLASRITNEGRGCSVEVLNWQRTYEILKYWKDQK